MNRNAPPNVTPAIRQIIRHLADCAEQPPWGCNDFIGSGGGSWLEVCPPWYPRISYDGAPPLISGSPCPLKTQTTEASCCPCPLDVYLGPRALLLCSSPMQTDVRPLGLPSGSCKPPACSGLFIWRLYSHGCARAIHMLMWTNRVPNRDCFNKRLTM